MDRAVDGSSITTLGECAPGMERTITGALRVWLAGSSIGAVATRSVVSGDDPPVDSAASRATATKVRVLPRAGCRSGRCSAWWAERRSQATGLLPANGSVAKPLWRAWRVCLHVAKAALARRRARLPLRVLLLSALGSVLWTPAGSRDWTAVSHWLAASLYSVFVIHRPVYPNIPRFDNVQRAKDRGPDQPHGHLD